MQEIHVIDSHTGGEPTRVVIRGGPALSGSDLAGRRDELRTHHDHFRRAVINEPRGWDAMVGALLCEPIDPTSAAGVIFFNNVGYLGMCVHGTIGVVATLAHQGRMEVGVHRLETPVGTVTVTLHDDGQVSVRNVPSYRTAKDVRVPVPGYGEVTGDVAWGGNWFFLVNSWNRSPDLFELSLSSSRSGDLLHIARTIRQALAENNITGAGGAEIDHIELFGPPSSPAADSKNFILCPGGAYDRSPCGTGTSAKIACLVADGKLRPGQVWRQESIIGSIFEAKAEIDADNLNRVIPTIKGSAHVTGEATLLLNPNDPFRHGIRQS